MFMTCWLCCRRYELGPIEYVKWYPNPVMCPFEAGLTSFPVLISSAETLIVYLDKLEEARFNEQNTGVSVVSWGDTIRKKQTDFSYCHMPLLNNQISHPPCNRGCTESHYLFCSWGERSNTSMTSSADEGGGGQQQPRYRIRVGHVKFCLFAHTCTSSFRYANDWGKTQMLKSTPLVFHFMISTWGR